MVDKNDLQSQLTAFVRAFGLHHPEQTPCGQPIAVAEAHALLELTQNAPLSQSELASRLRLEKSVLSRLAAQLERRGWVRRVRGTQDARLVFLSLSEQGQRVAEQLTAARSERFSRVFAQIPPTERESVLGALAVLVRAIQKTLAVALIALLIAGCGRQPYAGQEQRTIKALAPERVTELLEGKGAGYALAAELNHYPGPTHLLQLAKDLNLSPGQESTVVDVMQRMNLKAKELGTELVELEKALDAAFRTESITDVELAWLTSEIAGVEGRLRNTHLAAHLQVKKVLTAEQVKRYDELRGYASAGEGAPKGGQHGH